VVEAWLVEDDARLRESLSAALRSELCVTAFACGRDALGALQPGAAPDVGLIDLGLPDMSGLDLIAAMLAQRPALPLIALTVRFDDAAVFGALNKGAIGYVLKDVPAEEILGAVRQALAGGAPLSPSIARRVVRHFQPDASSIALFGLTGRERQVLEELCSGASYQEVAHRLGISTGTAHTHVKHVYEKLGATNKAEAVRIAFDSRLVAERHG
jgi:DNA-binding NarL/FixJ family response regulator